MMKPTFALFCLILITSQMVIINAAPNRDYDNIRELYEYLMQKQLMDDAYEKQLLQQDQTGATHRMVRKNTRSPSLRLRFGRRSDPSVPLMGAAYNYEDYPYGKYFVPEINEA